MRRAWHEELIAVLATVMGDRFLNSLLVLAGRLYGTISMSNLLLYWIPFEKIQWNVTMSGMSMKITPPASLYECLLLLHIACRNIINEPYPMLAARLPVRSTASGSCADEC